MAAEPMTPFNPGADNETPDPAAAALRLRRLMLIAVPGQPGQQQFIPILENDPRYRAGW